VVERSDTTGNVHPKNGIPAGCQHLHGFNIPQPSLPHRVFDQTSWNIDGRDVAWRACCSIAQRWGLEMTTSFRWWRCA